MLAPKELNLKTLLHLSKRLFILAYGSQYIPVVHVAARHFRARGVRLRTPLALFCTEKGRFEGCLVDILFIFSLFKCDLIYYSSVSLDDQVLAP